MKVQIYEHIHPNDVVASVKSGVDFIGTKPGENGLSPGELSYSGMSGNPWGCPA